MAEELRPTGIDVIGDVPWGTHFCHFYETKKDLLSVLVSFFKSGLENNEYCIWVISARITVDEAIIALKKVVPDLDKYLQLGSIEIVSYTDWYLKKGKLDVKYAVASLFDLLRIASQKNLDGVRANGDEAWLDRKEWVKFIEYEKVLNTAIAGKRVIIMCAYPLDKCPAATDMLDIALVHQSVIAKRKGRWEILESAELKKSKARLQREKEMLEINVAERTTDLEKVSSILDKSQSRLRAIFETTDIAFLLLDHDLKVLIYNSIANHWSELSFGVKLKEGDNFIELLKDDSQGPVREMAAQAMAGTPINYETSYPLLDGSSEWYYISINPVKDLKDQFIGLCCSATNITASKLAEIERIRISSDLVLRNQDLEQFAYIISHNLRAPLANIIGLSHMLKEHDLPPDEKIGLEEYLFQSIAKLDEIVNDLNQILQIRRDISEKKKKVTFSELANDVLTGFHQVIEQQHIKAITDFSQVNEIFTIKSYLYSIFYNLISNSIKYRQPEVPLVIEIKSSIQDNRIIITFKDNARGIDLSVHGADIFGLYKRFNSDVEGKGIGLYMVQHQAEALGGKISIASQLNIGSIFTVELPINK